MNFNEHAGKAVLKAAGIPTPEGILARTPDEAAAAPVFGRRGLKAAGVFAPRGTPEAVLDALNAILKDAVADPAVRQKLLAYHVEILSLSRSEMKEQLDTEFQKMDGLVRKHGIKPE